MQPDGEGFYGQHAVIHKDLLIIAPERVTFRDLVDHFTDLTRRYDICLERRGRERRSRATPASEERRKHDRRQSDFGERLRRNGWVIVPAAQRHSSRVSAAETPPG